MITSVCHSKSINLIKPMMLVFVLSLFLLPGIVYAGGDDELKVITEVENGYTYSNGKLVFTKGGTYTIEMGEGYSKTSHQIEIDGGQIFSGDVQTITLALKNLNIERTDGNIIINCKKNSYFDEHRIEIIFDIQGTNKITNAHKQGRVIKAQGVYPDNMTFIGNGTLTLETNALGNDCAINPNSFTLDSGSVTLNLNNVNINTNGAINIKNGSLNINNTTSDYCLITRGEFYMEGGVVNANCYKDYCLYLESTNATEAEHGGVYISGGKVTLTKTGTGDGILVYGSSGYRKGVYIGGQADVTIKTEYQTNSNRGIYMGSYTSGFTMAGGKLKIEGFQSGIKRNSGIAGDITFSGGETEISTTGDPSLSNSPAASSFITWGDAYNHKNYVKIDGKLTYKSDTDVLSGSVCTDNYLLITPAIDISYDLKGGALPEGMMNPEKYSRVDYPYTLNNPEKDGFSFTGWTGSNGETPQQSVYLPETATGSLSYTANWDSIINKDSPADLDLTYGYKEGSLTVNIENPDKYENISYQWYQCEDNSYTSCSAVSKDGTGSSYVIPEGKIADTQEYYYCEVTVSRIGISQTTSADSKIATVTVIPATIESLELTIPAPTAGEQLATDPTEKPDTVVSVPSSGSLSWSIGDVSVSAGSTADFNTRYTVSLTVKPKDGNYVFADMMAVTLNTNTEPLSFEINTDRTLTITYTFPATGKNPIVSATAIDVTYDPAGIMIPPDGMFNIAGSGKRTFEVQKGTEDTGDGNYPTADGKLTVTKAGTFTVKVSVEAAGDYAASTATAVLTVTKAAPDFSVSMESWTYGKAANDPEISGTKGDGAVSYTYYTDAECTTMTSAANSGAAADGGKPVWAGTWYVSASVPETDRYNAFTTKEAASFTIAKAAVTPSPSDVEISDLYTITSKTAALPPMPSDAGTVSYEQGAVTVSGQAKASAVIESGNITITLSGGADSDVIKVPVTVSSTNYQDVTLNVVLTLGPKADAVVSYEEGSKQTVTFGESLTLHAKAETEGPNEKWTWKSSNESVATVDSSGAVTILKAGFAEITAEYESDTTVGSAKFALTVEPKTAAVPEAVSGLKWTGEPQTGVPEGEGYTLSGNVETAPGNYTAEASLSDPVNMIWEDGTAEPKQISWSIEKADGPAAPALTGAAPTSAADDDGIISGCSPEMEYSLTPDFSQPISCTGTEITGLPAGTYYVRYRETATHKAGETAAVTVPPYDAPDPAAAPVLSPAEGSYTGPQSVTITCETEGAVIHYTTDGTEPTADSPVYSGPIPVTESLTIKAIAVKDGMSDSAVVSAVYTILPVPKSYTVTVENGTGSGSYTAGTVVSITADAAPAGETFDKWTSDDGVEFTDASSASTGFVMPAKDVTVTAAYKGEPMTLNVVFVNVDQSSSYGVPKEIPDLAVPGLVISIDAGDYESKTEKFTLKLTAGQSTVPLVLQFDRKVEHLAPGSHPVAISGLPEAVYGTLSGISLTEPPAGEVILWKYMLSARTEINEKTDESGKKIVYIRIYLTWDNGSSMPDEPVVRALPEDEIGAYKLNEDGTKEYLLFHTYSLCMDWLGRDELCRGYERCFHKENPYINPFVTP